MAKVSIVVTVCNESSTIGELLHALNNQTKKPDEIIVVDGGSTDNTWNILKKFTPPLRLRGGGPARNAFSIPASNALRSNAGWADAGGGVILNRSEGRNLGVSIAKGEIIAFTDAGCVPESTWLEELIKPFQKKLPSPRLGEGKGVRYSEIECVSGYYRGLPQNIFEKCLVPYVLVMPDRVGSEFLPSTRSMAITKKLFLSFGGFNPKLDTSEDFEFANRLKKAGIKIHFAKDAVVGWYPRKNLKQAAWMFLKFAVSDIYAGIFRPKVKLLILRYYLFFFLVFLNMWFGLLAVLYLIWSIIKNYKYVRNWRAIFWLPVLQLTADMMVIFGTVMGLLSRPKK